MKFKSLDRFYIFGVALMAMLYFFGIRSDHHTSYIHSEATVIAKMNAVHSSEPVHQPFEVEDKEEQPETETEDDETNESGISSPVFDSSAFTLAPRITDSRDDLVISGSQATYHTPVYVRLRTIII